MLKQLYQLLNLIDNIDYFKSLKIQFYHFIQKPI